MKRTAPNTAKSTTISRDAIALTALFAATQGTAQTTAPQASENEDPEIGENEMLPETVVQSTAESAYNASRLASDKFTAPLLDTPQTYSVIPEEVYKEQSARNLRDVLKNTPGISFNAGENGFASSPDSNFSMRGTDSSGSVYIDGIRDSGSYSRDIFNIERVEIAKGPAADNGRGGAGGYVNLISKVAGDTNFLRGTTSFGYAPSGGDGLFRQSLDWNQTLDDAPLPGSAFRLNALFQDGGVYGRDVAELNSWGLAPSFTTGLGTDTVVSISYQHTESHDLPDWGLPAAFFEGTINYDPSIAESNRSNFFGLSSDYDDTISDALTAVITHDFASGGVLTNTTRISHTQRDSIFTVPAGYDPATRQVTTRQLGYGRENTLFANQTNYSLEFETGNLRHTLSTGLELSREKSEADRFGTVTDPGGSTVSVDGSSPNRANGNLIGAPTQFSEVEIDTIAAYVYDTVEINEQWQLTGGLRIEHYSLDLTNTPATAAVPSFSKSDTYITGKLGAIYKPQENGSIYAAVGVSALPPAAFLSNPDASRTGDNGFPGAGGGVNNPNADTQLNWNYEIGTKWDFFDGRLSTTAAAFHTVRTNIAISDGRGNTIGEGEQNLTGIELGVAGQITDNWQIFGGFLAMTSERDHFDDFRNSSGRPEGALVDRTNVNGDELAFTPNYSANLWTTYDFANGLTLGGGMQYVGSSYVGRTDDHDRIIPNGTYGKLPDYIVFNALVSYEVSENVTLRLNVDNVFDEVYAVTANWPSTRAVAGPPRTFTLSADWEF